MKSVSGYVGRTNIVTQEGISNQTGAEEEKSKDIWFRETGNTLI
jgi:hypothetical protein